MSELPGSTEDREHLWWLATGDKPEGPFKEASVLEQLQSHQIPPTSLACPVGGQEWRPLGEWPVFAPAAVPTSNMSHTVSPPTAVTAVAPVLTNPLLPSMANWICVYAILVSPFLWFVQNASCCMTFSCPFQEGSGFDVAFFCLESLDSLIALGLAIVLLVGGIRLRSLRRSGATIIRGVLWMGLIWTVVYLVCGGLLVVIGGINGNFAETTSSTTAQELISFASVLLYLAGLAFQIIALVWLHRNASILPLTET